MTIAALLDLHLRPDALDRAPAVIRETLAVTRGFAGCLSLEVLQDDTDPTHVLIYERWDSAESDAAYRAFRASPEGTSDLATVLATPPALTYFTIAEG